MIPKVPPPDGSVAKSASISKIPELDALRALLAWWVVMDHLLGTAGYGLSELPGPLKLIRSGWLAVDVFIILSGLVVTILLNGQSVSYPAFIIRRFFRLVPVYLPCLLFGWLGMYLTERTYGLLPGFPGREMFMQRWGETESHLAGHVMAHLSLLHGAIPNQILPYSGGALLDPAWSISLEWQFYLIAPFVIALGRRSTGWFLGLSLFAVLGGMIQRHVGEFDFGSFLPGKLHMFWLGIVSFYLLKAREKLVLNHWDFNYVLAGMLMFPLLFFRDSPSMVPLMVWLPILALLMAPETMNTRLVGMLRGALRSSPLVALGQVSYVTYLLHVPVLQFLRWAVVFSGLITGRGALAFTLAVVGIPVVLVFSFWVSTWIEKPGIEIGRRMAARFR
jgi:peptidoglycan/LPS O-acetylase OafA/YrhL